LAKKQKLNNQKLNKYFKLHQNIQQVFPFMQSPWSTKYNCWESFI